MSLRAVTLAILLMVLPVAAYSDECTTSDMPLVQLLDTYSKTYGTKFVVDPRVRAKVTLIGIDSSVIDTATLIGVLNLHGYTARDKEGVVYVMPYKVSESFGDKFGPTWDG